MGADFKGRRTIIQESRIVQKQTKYSLDSLPIFGHVRIGQTGLDLPISYENTRFYWKTGCFSGASDLTRTGDLLITRVGQCVLYRVINVQIITL